MGLFDEINCKYPLPDSDLQDTLFQTKSLECAMDRYTITPDGRLILHEVRYESVPDEERPLYGTPEWENSPLSQMLGSIKSVPIGDVEIPYHGYILFYTYVGQPSQGEMFEYLAKFTEGQVMEIKRVRNNEVENLPERSSGWWSNQAMYYLKTKAGAAGWETAVQIDDLITFEVSFDPAGREEGFPDDIRFAIRENGPRQFRIFAADETSLLLTVEQAEQLAVALLKAAEESRKTS